MKTDWEKKELRGAVKTVLAETMTFEEQVNQTIEKWLSTETMFFNEHGWLTEQTTQNANGFESRTVSEYSDSHKLVRTRKAWDIFVQEVAYIYDCKERLIAEQHIANGNVTTPITYSYETGVKIEIQELNPDPEADVMVGIEGMISTINASGATWIETRYDDRDNPVEVKALDAAGSLVGRVEIIRDERGNSLEETHYYGDSVRFGPGSSIPEEIESLSDEEKAEFTAVVARYFSPGKAISKQIHTYDVEGRLIESKLTTMGILFIRQMFSYDEYGNQTETVSCSEQSQTLRGKAIFTRDYDEHGNWTRELFSQVSSWDAQFGLSTPMHVTRRTITYFT